ncbi:MAG: hypothetical protein JWM80_3170 [Cyanobacteria bacterium RYN_339]|nr:hypothetical protein [Cyanobacteria bacterium RYN_339]
MNKVACGWVLGLLTLSGCAVVVPAGHGPVASTAPATDPTSPVASGKVAKLQAAPGAVSLAGTVGIDPRFLVASRAAVVFKRGGGSVLAVGGGNLVAADGAGVTGGNGHPLISQDGGGLISNDGNSVVGPDGGGLISQDGGGLISQDGGGLISQDGGGFAAPDGNTLIGQDGAGLISQDGGGLISVGSGGLASKLMLLAAEAVPLPPDLAASLPAAGMWVGARSLRDGKPVPVGLDPAGKPVYTVFSNADGKYELFLDPALKDDVRLVAAVPGAREARHFYNLLTPAQADATQASMSEDKSLATSLVRFTLSRWLVNLMAGRSDFVFEDIAPEKRALLPAELLDRAKAVVDNVAGMARNTNLYAHADRPDLQRRVTMLFADRLLLEQDMTLDGAPVTPLRGPAIDSLVQIFKELNERARALPEAQLQAMPFMVQVNRERIAQKLPPYHVIRGSDLADVFIEEFLAARDQKQTSRANDAFAQLGMDAQKGRDVLTAMRGISTVLADRLMNGKVGGRPLDQVAADIVTANAPAILAE